MSVRSLRLPALLAGTLCALWLVFAQSAFAQAANAMDERRYDIPAQPVAQALAEFATVSGVSILYRQSLAGDRHSTPLEGIYAAPAGLRHLLQGTGLSARFTGPNSAVIFVEGQQPPPIAPVPGTAAGLTALRLDMAEVRAPRTIGGTDTGAFSRYARRVQAEIFERLKRDGAYEGRSFNIEIAVRVDSAGRIDDVAFLRGSAEPDWDTRVRDILVGAHLSSPPPAGFNRSMRFEVETDRHASRNAPRRGRSRP
ncbi:STN domain-containing protein [Sphingobium baderi]|uniref:Secretin/TonB short N-terminal domain-containing protein n=1 Tax=Sphingobium baderi TaxID=1332080 RepID=A0A0S3EZQ7_9SPHN|nr:STN domain-containing protein [Sphingobium baderi]ALR20910.1 hypothetical protein ATN00_11985 [Sphingobium baderi]